MIINTPKNRLNKAKSPMFKRIVLLLMIAVLTIPALFSDAIQWQGSTNLHTLMEVVATVLALMIAAAALVRYYAMPDERLLLYVGVGFLGTGLLDGYHAVVTAELFSIHFPSPNETLIPWSWVASRLYLSLFFASAWYRLITRSKDLKLSSVPALITMSLSVAVIFVFFAFVPLPKAYYSDFIIHRPGELLPGILFCIALVGFFKRGRWLRDDFEFWILIFLIVSIVGQLLYMPFSNRLFDYQFDFAHLLKKLSYIAVLTGVFVSLLQSYRWQIQAALDLEDMSITQRELEEKIKEQAERVRLFSDAIQQSTEAVAITNQEGVIQYINKAFTDLTGYSFKETLGQTPRVLNSGFHDSSFYEDMWGTIKSGEPWHHRIVNRRKDNTLFPSLLAISPIKNDEGKITNFVGIQQDLTSYETLEEQFQQSQKMEAIGTLVGGIAHDFNNTLAGIVGNVFILRQKLEDPEAIKRIDIINDLSMRTAEMIRNLLAFARKDSRTMNPLRVSSFLKEIIKLACVSIPENIRFIDKVSHQDTYIMGDINLLQQVFINLINNARDAVEINRDEKIISIDLTVVPKTAEASNKYPDLLGEHFACIEVKDNGCGIPAEELDRIFEPFYTTKDVGKGTGLGLAMSYGAIKSHQGVVDVESELNNGSTFRVYIPVLTSEQVIAMPTDAEALIHGHGETILFVDDEKSVLDTGKSVLESIGYQVILANNGLEAVNIFKEQHEHISLVISDLVMPVKSGKEAANEIREINPDMLIIFITGYSAESEKYQDLMNEIVLNKPFTAITLSQKVAEVLQNK